MSLTDRIRTRLDVVGLKPAQASKAAGLGHTYVRDVLQGKVANPRTEHLARLAKVLKTTPEWLSEGRGDEEPSKEQLEFERVQRTLRRIAPEDLPAAERALKGFVRDDTPANYNADKARPNPRRRRGSK